MLRKIICCNTNPEFMSIINFCIIIHSNVIFDVLKITWQQYNEYYDVAYYGKMAYYLGIFCAEN